MKHLLILVGIIIPSFLYAQLEVVNATGNILPSGSLVNMGTYDSAPVSESRSWSLRNTGSKTVRIKSCDVVSSTGVNYGNGIENSGINISEGQVVGDPVDLTSNQTRDIKIRFYANLEATYRKSLKISYYEIDDDSGLKVEPENKVIEIPIMVTIDLPEAPIVEEPDGEPIPSQMTRYFPPGFPTGDILYYGDYRFGSATFGFFNFDPSIEDRFIHDVIGPTVWEQDSTTGVVTLFTEWWGNLYTFPPQMSVNQSPLGIKWPYVKSEITGAIYYVDANTDMSNPLRTPYYNHRQINGLDIGWQRSIGVDLSSAANYYKAAETIVGQMQMVLQRMGNLQQEYIDLNVSIAEGQGPIDQKFDQVNAQFLAMHEVYTKFVFYYHRCSLAPVWAEREGQSQAKIDLAQWYVDQLPNLEGIATTVYGNGQEVLYVNCVNLKTQKTNEFNQLVAAEAAARKAAEDEAARKAAEDEAARKAAEDEANKNNSNNSGNSGSGNTSPQAPQDIIQNLSWRFSGNAKPSGTTMYTEGMGGIKNDRLQAAPTDSRAQLTFLLSYTGNLKEVVIEYDGNVDYSFWGMNNRIYLHFNGDVTFYTPNGYNKYNYGAYHYLFISKSKNGSTSNNSWKYDYVSGDYHYKLIVKEGILEYSCVRKAGNTRVFKQVINDSDIKMSQLGSIGVEAYTTTSATSWVDDVLIQIVSL